ncbi:MAG: hypothetical protein Q4P25_04705 [Tissierellia bacterium]|nr:hypothetical protein [Tissierellia bacterium]
MGLLELFIERMQEGNAAKLADLFCDDGVIHDSSYIKVGKDTLHVVGKMGIEMIFHNRFGMNRGPFKITSVQIINETTAWYFITHNNTVVPVTAFLSAVEDGKIKRLNIYPL